MRPKIYSLMEAAAVLKYASSAVLRNEIADGRIKAEKLGNQWFISQSEMERLYRYRSNKHILGHLFYCATIKTHMEDDCTCLKGKMEAADSGGFSGAIAGKLSNNLK